MTFSILKKVNRFIFLIACLGLCFGFSKITYADFDAGVKALNDGDYATALVEARKAADAGDARSYDLLGFIFENGLGVKADVEQAFNWYKKSAQNGSVENISKVAASYYRGVGVAQDKDRALMIVRDAAKKLNDPESQLLVFLFLSDGELNTSDNQGKRDEKKFQQLAARPISERDVDIEANDSLYRSTAEGLSRRSPVLADFLMRRSGKESRQKLYALLQKIAQNTPMIEKHKELLGYKVLIEKINALGESEASPQLFADAQAAGAFAAKVKGCGLDSSNKEMPQIIATKVSHPLNRATYLPSQVAGYEHIYLISGVWQEEWVYQACGNRVSVNMQFSADGLGGATFMTSEMVDPKKL
ncbi:MAG: sel1 repeat family protein [Ottowia sp.]|nr:sel1 repeat family protein [Ottowia sp.]